MKVTPQSIWIHWANFAKFMPQFLYNSYNLQAFMSIVQHQKGHNRGLSNWKSLKPFYNKLAQIDLIHVK